MIDVNIASFAAQNPDIAREVFTQAEAAAQLLLPGSEYHPRYEHASAVGLASVIASGEILPDALNPTRPGAPEHTVFMADNQQSTPALWLPLEANGGLLGGEPQPEVAGRFIAFALAKANRLTLFPHETSSYHEKLTLAPGVVGFAGARRVGSEIISTSGLLEVHDDVVSLAQARELIRHATVRGYQTNPDEMTEQLQNALHKLAVSFPQIPEITPDNRNGLRTMLIANRMFFDLDGDFR